MSILENLFAVIFVAAGFGLMSLRSDFIWGGLILVLLGACFMVLPILFEPDVPEKSHK